MRPLRRRRATVVAALGCLAALGATGCGQAGQFAQDDPRSAVGQFLVASIAQANGQRACSLMSAAARARMAQTLAGSCRQALNNANSTLPGSYDSTEDAGRAVADLDYEVKQQGDRATVTVRHKADDGSGGGDVLTFRLILLSKTAAEHDLIGREEDAPNTRWRVDFGADQVLRVDPSRPGPQTTSTPAPATTTTTKKP